MNDASLPPEIEAVSRKAAGSSFYSAMKLLPKAQREGMYAIYAFCRAVDDIADEDAPLVGHLLVVVRRLASQLGLKPFQLISDLMEMNIFAAINHTLEPEIAAGRVLLPAFVPPCVLAQ